MKRFIQGNWSQIKARLKAKYARLSDSDLNYEDGSEDILLKRLQRKLQMGEQELMHELKRIITQTNS